MAVTCSKTRKINLQLIFLVVCYVLAIVGCVSLNISDVTLTQTSFENITLHFAPNSSISANFYYPVKPTLNGNFPGLVMISHGNLSQKEAHTNQCLAITRRGMACLVMQLPNFRQWTDNGIIIWKLSQFIYNDLNILPAKIDKNKILLAGHSFGGSAVSIAASLGAPVSGIILLDPALVSKSLIKNLRQIRSPVFLLGADRRIYSSRYRRLFYPNLTGEYGELSVAGSTHNDAQNPSLYSLESLGFDPFSHATKRTIFTDLLTDAAQSIVETGSFERFAKSLEKIKSVTLERFKLH